MASVHEEIKPESVGLPPVTFLYTLDQIATMINKELDYVKRNYLYYEGFTGGVRRAVHMHTVNINQIGEPPDWRVAQQEFLRWLKLKGFHVIKFGVIK